MIINVYTWIVLAVLILGTYVSGTQSSLITFLIMLPVFLRALGLV